MIGLAVGLPALRVKGIYLAIATLGFSVIVEHTILHWDSLTNGSDGLAVSKPAIFGFAFSTETRFYYLAMLVILGLTFVAMNMRRCRIGRAFIAVRESDLAAEVMGVNLAKYKTLSFAVCAFYAGIAGSLYAHHIAYIGPDHFTLFLSIEYLVIILVGGVGSILGSILGTAFFTLFPEMIRIGSDILKQHFPSAVSALPDLRILIFVAMMIFFIIFEPQGLNGYWLKIKRYFSTWPF
jgi:branched-chain amino acid transport system permease protein